MGLTFIETSINGAFTIAPSPFKDKRGWFMRTYCKDEIAAIGHTADWVQMNHSCTAEVGSIRGMHFQRPPYAEIKMVRCVAGEVFDVIVDLRVSSPTFLKWTGVTLSAENKLSLYIPKGVAHGFQVLKKNSQLIYMHSALYNQQAEGGILYNDPAVSIKWPLKSQNLSIRDLSYQPIDKNFKGIKI